MESLPACKKASCLFPVIFALLFFVQGFFGSLNKSLTWDEPVFIASGLTYLVRNDFRMNREAPPLMQQLEALPLLSMHLTLPDRNDPIWQKGQHIKLSRKFVHDNGARVREIAIRARLPVLLIGAGLVSLLFLWGRRLYGIWPAAAAAAVASCSPNLLAHAKLATTDLGCAAFLFLSVFLFWNCIQTGRKRDWILLGAATGLALLAKYTALLLGPIFIILAGVCLYQKRIDPPALLKGLLISSGVALIMIGAGYNFSFNLPLYLKGMQKIYANATPGYQFYLQGNISQSPWWYYYLVVFFLKVPVPVILLMALALFSIIRRPGLRDTAPFLLVPALVIIGASCFDKTNLGFRRILPALPFLILFCAEAPARFRSRLGSLIVAGLVVWSAVEAVRIYPDHLSYLNTIAGGPERGPYHLDDSNIDWGQDLPALAAWQREHSEARPLKLRYFGNVPPEIYGVDAIEMEDREINAPGPGTYAVSAHRLVWFRKIQKEHHVDTDWLTKYEPVARAGYSIYIYQFPE